MKTRRFFFRLGVMIAPLAAALMLAGPATPAAAASTIVVDSTPSATDCGNYTGSPAQTNLVDAVANVADNTTIVVCPGTYTLNDELFISNKNKITIKAAVADPGKRPVLLIGSGEIVILEIGYAQNTTIDGLILDGRGDTEPDFVGITVSGCKATLRNVTVIGPTVGSSSSVILNMLAFPTVYPVSISNSYFVGYNGQGILADGAVKLSVTSSYFDSTDDGRLPFNGVAVQFQSHSGKVPAGSVTKSQMLNNETGVEIDGASKVSVTSNTIVNSLTGIKVHTDSATPDIANTKITSNQILATRAGVWVDNEDAAIKSITKTTISKNLITAEQFDSYAGIYVQADTLAGAHVTGTISNNILMGFDATGAIVFDLASMTVSKNTIMP